MTPQAAFMAVCLVLAALGFGCWLGDRDSKRKPRDHRQPSRYWRE